MEEMKGYIDEVIPLLNVKLKLENHILKMNIK